MLDSLCNAFFKKQTKQNQKPKPKKTTPTVAFLRDILKAFWPEFISFTKGNLNPGA